MFWVVLQGVMYILCAIFLDLKFCVCFFKKIFPSLVFWVVLQGVLEILTGCSGDTNGMFWRHVQDKYCMLFHSSSVRVDVTPG